MENVTDALKMAAAVLIFVGALSMAIMAFTKARQAATNMLGKDKIALYYDLEDNYTLNREVSIDTVISNMYTYKNTRSTLLFYTGSVDENNNIKMEPLTLYNTNALDNDRKYSFLIYGDSNSTKIYGLDITDERTRNEPWTSTDKATKDFIDCLIKGTMYEYDSSRSTRPDKKMFIEFEYKGSLSNNTFSQYSPKYKIIERVGHFNYEDIHVTPQGSEPQETYRSTNLSDSVTVFSNNEVIENEEGNDKKVIQYIFTNKEKISNSTLIFY